MKKSPELEELAKAHVGDDRSNLTFVTVGGKVRAVFVGRSEDAEDKTGVVWESD